MVVLKLGIFILFRKPIQLYYAILSVNLPRKGVQPDLFFTVPHKAGVEECV